jgi:hypothetical protein
MSIKLNKIYSNYSYGCPKAYQAFKLLETQRIQHASSFSVAPRAANYAKYKLPKQKLIGAMEESHTKEQSPKTFFRNGAPSKEIEKFSFVNKNTRERELLGIFARGKRRSGLRE